MAHVAVDRVQLAALQASAEAVARGLEALLAALDAAAAPKPQAVPIARRPLPKLYLDGSCAHANTVDVSGLAGPRTELCTDCSTELPVAGAEGD